MRRALPTARDIKAWRKLVDEAARVVADPARPKGDLAKRGYEVRFAVVPSGPWDRSNIFFALLDTARVLCAGAEKGQPDLGGVIAQVLAADVARCQAELARIQTVGALREPSPYRAPYAED